MEKVKRNKQYKGDEKLITAFETVQIMNLDKDHKLVLDQIKELNLKSKKDNAPVSPKRQNSKIDIK